MARSLLVSASYVFLLREGAAGTEVLLHLRRHTGYRDGRWARRPATSSTARRPALPPSGWSRLDRLPEPLVPHEALVLAHLRSRAPVPRSCWPEAPQPVGSVDGVTSAEQTTGANGVGLATRTADGTVLDTWYPAPTLSSADQGETGTQQIGVLELEGLLGPDFSGLVRSDEARGVEVVAVATTIADLAAPAVDAHDVYLRLHLLSHRLVQPRSIDLGGVFGLLANVAWTSAGPVLGTELDAVRARLRVSTGGHLTVFGVDKFPRMVDYVVPSGVRIADADRVRLGAHLAEGTTVMHEGFVNYNAGTLGPSMVEGRISAGVVVDADSDIGGGASIMGTLSGGGKQVVSIGKGCLLGANAGIGISLGDGCVVEAGCYVTAGSKVQLPDGTAVKAAELSGRDGLLFRRNSVSGALEALPRNGDWGALNAALHAN